MSQGKPFEKESQGALLGQGRIALSLGADDPRGRRNAAGFMSADMIGAGITLDQAGRITLKVKEESAVGTDADGFVELFNDASMEQTPGSRTTLRNTARRLLDLITKGRRRGQLEGDRLVLEDVANVRPNTFGGARNAREVMEGVDVRTRTLETTVAILVVAPPLHAATHTEGGTDEIAITGLQIIARSGAGSEVAMTDGPTIDAATLTGTTTLTGDVLMGSSAPITAHAGGGQALATLIAAHFVYVVVATAGDSVKLPAPVADMEIEIRSESANALDVFPQSGLNINALANNVAYSLPGLRTLRLRGRNATTWFTTGQIAN